MRLLVLCTLYLVAVLLSLQLQFATAANNSDTGNFSFESAGMQLYLDELTHVDGVVWALDFIDAQTIIFTVRRGDIMLFDLETRKAQKLTGGPAVHRVMGGGPFDQVASGGLFDVLVDPGFANNRFIYLAYVKKTPEGHALAVARAQLAGNRLEGLQDIFIANNASEEAGRWGTRLAMDSQRYLYIAVGDRRVGDNAQDLANHCGKIVRLHADGSVPDDNPFVGDEDAAPEVWSYGHRNPQGLAFHPETGELFEHEHGPDGGDEINLIQPGKNYGWPVISYGVSRAGTPVGIGTAKEGMEQPLRYYKPGIAPSGMSFSSTNRYPGWKGNLFIGSLNRMRLNRVVVDGHDVVEEEEQLLADWGERIREVTEGPDGWLYLATGSGRIVRIQR
jgi:glucose/arabinose dehydrogenase